MVTGQEDLGGLAGEPAERRDVSDRIAGEKRGERLTRVRRRPAARTAARLRRERQSADPASAKMREQSPADALNAIEDLGDAGPAGRPGKEEPRPPSAAASESRVRCWTTPE